MFKSTVSNCWCFQIFNAAAFSQHFSLNFESITVYSTNDASAKSIATHNNYIIVPNLTVP